jgi:predicted lipoprotein with Yx(FWY)xxD motif
MKTSTLVGAVAILLFAAGAWYYLAKVDMTSLVQDQGAPSGTLQKPMEDGAEGSIIGNNPALGLEGSGPDAHLVAYNGMTLYTFTKDLGSLSSCYDQCAINWPPYVVGPEDNVQNVKEGVTGKVDTVFRSDGSIQVTYNGKPLYFWKDDKKAGDITGKGVGGVWNLAL